MIISASERIPGKKISQHFGLVTGNVVRSKHVGRDIMAFLKNIVGGEIVGYTEMLSEARDVALQRMVEQAQKQGANAVVNVRFNTSSISNMMSEILAYGDAVVLSPEDA
ncbi:MAG: hypothetical protein CENE_00201 [Candidatus Celerinatantimonas neptuna]|nr:MAG: hypothetical protein CENE_00201 [Candidatus Celerinatantimonas neptuna]